MFSTTMAFKVSSNGQVGAGGGGGGPTDTLKSRLTSVHPVALTVTMTFPVDPWILGSIVNV